MIYVLRSVRFQDKCGTIYDIERIFNRVLTNLAKLSSRFNWTGFLYVTWANHLIIIHPMVMVLKKGKHKHRQANN